MLQPRMAWTWHSLMWSFLHVIAITTVVGQQQFLVEPEDSVVNKGSWKILNCQVANLLGEVQWMRNGFGLGTGRTLEAYERYTIKGNEAQGEYNLMVNNAQLEDDGTYECQVMATTTTAALRSQQAYLTVQIEPDFPTVQGGPVVQVEANKPVNLTCEALHGKPAANITWISDGVTLTDNTYYESVLDAVDKKRQDAKGMLTITPRKADHGKRYECHASNAATVHSRWVRVSLDVQYAPEVTMTVSPSKNLKEYDSMSFSCDGVGNPDVITWKWYEGTDEIQGATTRSLDLPSISRTHHGKDIACEATNSIGSTRQTFNMKVEYGPQFTSGPVHVEVDVGEDATLLCNVDSNPAPAIIWTRKGLEQILSSNNMYRVAAVEDVDFGTYTCRASVIGYEEIIMDVHLLKKGPPTIRSEPKQYAKFGDTGRVICDTRSVPKPSAITWSRDGQALAINSMERYEVNEEDWDMGRRSTLLIASVQDGDFGEFNCTVVNGYGQDMTIIKLIRKDAVNLTYILAGVLGGVALVIIITIAIFAYHRWRSSASDAGSQDSDASMTKEKDDSNPHIKVEYGSPVDAWRTDMDDRMYRHSAEYDELNSYARDPRNYPHYNRDYPDSYNPAYDVRDHRSDYGTYPGAAASRQYDQGPAAPRFEENPYGPVYGSDYGGYRAMPPARQTYTPSDLMYGPSSLPPPAPGSDIYGRPPSRPPSSLNATKLSTNV